MEFCFKTRADYNKFLNFLEFGTLERVSCREKHLKVLSTTRKTYFLSMNSVKTLAKNIANTDAAGFLKFVKNDSYEEVLIWGIVIVLSGEPAEQIQKLDVWKEVADSWSLIDCVCSQMTKLKKSKDKAKYFDYFKNLCLSEEEFVSRLGIVALMSCYLEDEFIDEVLDVACKVKCKKYYASMAVSWLICESYVKFKEKTLKLFEAGKLDDFVTNKAISKCRDSFRISKSEKENLLKFKRK